LGRGRVIEDEQNLAGAARTRLASEGHTVAVIHCGREGLTVARELLA
jgi:DNA-binding response OmpR family regulator